MDEGGGRLDGACSWQKEGISLYARLSGREASVERRELSPQLQPSAATRTLAAASFLLTPTTCRSGGWWQALAHSFVVTNTFFPILFFFFLFFSVLVFFVALCCRWLLFSKT